MKEITTIKLEKKTKKRLDDYKDYPEQTYNNLITALLNALDEYATTKAKREKQLL